MRGRRCLELMRMRSRVLHRLMRVVGHLVRTGTQRFHHRRRHSLSNSRRRMQRLIPSIGGRTLGTCTCPCSQTSFRRIAVRHLLGDRRRVGLRVVRGYLGYSPGRRCHRRSMGVQLSLLEEAPEGLVAECLIHLPRKGWEARRRYEGEVTRSRGLVDEVLCNLLTYFHANVLFPPSFLHSRPLLIPHYWCR